MKKGERWREEWSFKEFKGFIQENGVVNMGFEEVLWTWGTWRRNGGENKERLDRMLSMDQWVLAFPNASVRHVQNEASDHLMLVIDTFPHPKRVARRFYFYRKWLPFGDVGSVVERAWGKYQSGSRAYRVVGKIGECKRQLLN